MPKFDLETVERWEHKVNYYDVEADTLQQAFAEVVAGNVDYDEHEQIEDPANEVIRLWSVYRDGIELEVPDDLGADLEQVTSGKQLVDAATKALAYICNVNTAEPQEVIDELRQALGVTEGYKVSELAAPLVEQTAIPADLHELFTELVEAYDDAGYGIGEYIDSLREHLETGPDEQFAGYDGEDEE